LSVKILGIDTALGACSAALLDGGHVLAHEHENMARGHAEALAPMVARVMAKAGVAFSALDLLAVTTGPGTFTGQRVGLAFVRGLALALKRGAAGVTTLDAMAAEVLERERASWAVIVADAKRGEVYLGARSAQGATLIAPTLVAVEDAVALIAAKAPLFGSSVAVGGTAAEAIAPRLAAKGLSPNRSTVEQPDAVFVAGLAAAMPEPTGPPRPLYLRAPDAKLPGAA
jgi:tRNA threonylcarbamoyladenosine biosynthesis protein TsaB